MVADAIRHCVTGHFERRYIALQRKKAGESLLTVD
jgi:hypothetical protein